MKKSQSRSKKKWPLLMRRRKKKKIEGVVPECRAAQLEDVAILFLIYFFAQGIFDSHLITKEIIFIVLTSIFLAIKI